MPPRKRVLRGSSEEEENDDVLDLCRNVPVPVNPEECLSWDQRARIARMRAQPLYLIDITTTGSKTSFKVAGSTANLYTVTVDPAAVVGKKLARCDCPDASLGARFRKCHCKHVCYALMRACGMPADILAEGPVTQAALLERKMAELVANRTRWTQLTNAEMQARYASLTEAFTVPADKVLDVCSICCEDQSSTTESAACPGCRNVLHRACISEWLKISGSNCPLCRSPWTGFVPGTINLASRPCFICSSPS